MNAFRDSLITVPAITIAMVFFVLIFTLNWVGYRVRKRLSRLNPDKDMTLGAAEGSLMGLMALLMAFSFSMSFAKFDNRRQTIVEEANLINTAIQRTDVFPDSVKPQLKIPLQNYLESRIRYFDAGDNRSKIDAALSEGTKHFNQLWKNTVRLTEDAANRSRADQLIPALIGMKNMVTTRDAGRAAPVPTLIVIVLLILVFIASFISGYGVKPGNRNILFSLTFALMTSTVLFTVMELGRPRQGFINLGNAEQRIIELRAMFP